MGLNCQRGGEVQTLEEKIWGKDEALRWVAEKTVAEITVHFPVLLSSFKSSCKRGVESVFKARAHSTLPLLSPHSLLYTLKAQAEAGVDQLNIDTFLAFIRLHTYLTFMNGALLTPFNSHSKEILLAQLMCNN